MADDKATLTKLTKQFAAMKKAMDTLEQQIKQTQSRVAAHEVTRKPKIWTPKDGDQYFFLDEAGAPNVTVNREPSLLRQGNFFATLDRAEHAAFLHRSINVQLGFSYSNGGNGMQQVGSYCLGQEGILKANTLPYPTMVYFKDESTAAECFRYLRRKKWLVYGAE